MCKYWKVGLEQYLVIDGGVITSKIVKCHVNFSKLTSWYHKVNLVTTLCIGLSGTLQGFASTVWITLTPGIVFPSLVTLQSLAILIMWPGVLSLSWCSHGHSFSWNDAAFFCLTDCYTSPLTWACVSGAFLLHLSISAAPPLLPHQSTYIVLTHLPFPPGKRVNFLR